MWKRTVLACALAFPALASAQGGERRVACWLHAQGAAQ